MANFRIKVEYLNPDMETSEELMNGIECNGFFMGLDRDDQDTTIIQHMTCVNMAAMIAKSTNLLEAAMIAHGMEEARLMRKNRESQNGAALLAKLIGKADD
jgi:hypothetical protein